MAAWRTSTWVWIVCGLAALVAEVIYAAEESELQGRALAALIIVSIILAVYRGMTRQRSA